MLVVKQYLKHLLGVNIFSLILFSVSAQNDSTKTNQKNVFSSQVLAGVLEGSGGSAFQLQVINGVSKAGWFTGLGTGIDYYFFRSIPVFLSVTKVFTESNNSFFAQADAGVNFGWTNQEINRFNNVISDKFKSGLYWNSALGISTMIGSQKSKLLFSLGYSYKHLQEIKEVQVFCINPPCQNQVEEYNYHLRRLSFKIGWQFKATH